MIILREDLTQDMTPAQVDGNWKARYRPGSTVTISSGVVNVAGTGWYRVDTQGAAATDDLDQITGTVEGDEVILRLANPARQVILKHGTFLKLADNLDCELNSAYDHITLKNWGGGALVELARVRITG